MPRARRILEERRVYGEAEHVELEAWQVPASRRAPAWVKFRFAYVRAEAGVERCIYRLDNCEDKGPHEHLGEAERKLPTEDLDELVGLFFRQVDRLRKGG